MSAIVCEKPTGLLSIDGIALNGPAWNAADVFELWLGGDLKGSNLPMPLVTGDRPYPRRFTTTRVSLPFVIVGSVTRLGVPNANHWAGLEVNIDYLRTNVVDPVNSATGTRLAVLTKPSGAQVSGPVHVLGLTTVSKGGGIDLRTGEPTVVWDGNLELSRPYGALTSGGS
jgi:hypothetical protein